MRASLTTINSKSDSLHWKQGAVVPALVAMLAVQMFRAQQHRWLPAIWLECLVLALVPIGLFLLIRKWTSKNSLRPILPQKTMYLAQAGTFLSVLILLIGQLVSRSIGLGDANEIVALLVIQTISWNLAVFASIRGFEKASFVLCAALVFFVCCMTTRLDIFVAGGCFAVASLWWMAGLYWSRLDSKAIDGDAKVLAIHGSTTGIAVVTIAAAIGLSLLIPFSRGQFSVVGFMPFSGGEDGYQDEFAISGVGDGNMLTGGTNATTVGAVETDQFIEDDKPSMYDVMTEQYDGPVMKKKLNRAVALDKKAKHIHDVKQSEQAGRTFRTMRNTDRELDLEYKDRISDALFFVEGPVPARFINDSFQHFDGWDWTKTSVANETPLPSKIELQRALGGKPVFKLSRFKPDYLTSTRSHRVKVMRLQTDALPAPNYLDRWHISKIDNADFFKWNEAGIIRFDSEAIPSQTVIDLKSFVPNYHVMRSVSDLRRCRQVSTWNQAIGGMLNNIAGLADASNSQPAPPPIVIDKNSPYLQIPDNAARSSIDSVVRKYIVGVRPGWNQVEAIVGHFRNDFELKRDWQADPSIEDTVGHFFDQKGGPSWMFATSCAMVLRSAGYRTRLTSGFIVLKDDYDSQAKQSIVTSKNLHMWPEVCLDGKFWIPVEPTPGFPVPYSTETTLQWLTAKALGVLSWIWSHKLASLMMSILVTLCYRLRANLITSFMLVWWMVVRFLWPSHLLCTTRQLIDLRFWAAGDRRPLCKTIRNWYTRVEPEIAGEFFDLWNARNYSNAPENTPCRDLVASCKEQVETLTLSRIQTYLINRERKRLQ